jgi:hypothetical protein
MTETKHKEHITSKHFGIPADLADLAENYAQWRVQALSEQLAEAQALIEASRNQEPAGVLRSDEFDGHVFEPTGSWPFGKLYTTPVVAPDVLKDAERYRWIREYLPSTDTSVDDDLVAALNPQEIDAVIDAAIGDANE